MDNRSAPRNLWKANLRGEASGQRPKTTEPYSHSQPPAPGPKPPNPHANQKPDLAGVRQIWSVISRPQESWRTRFAAPAGESRKRLSTSQTSEKWTLVRDGGGIGRARPVSLALSYQRGKDGRWRLHVSLREHQTGQVQTTPRAMAAPFHAQPAPIERLTSVPATGM